MASSTSERTRRLLRREMERRGVDLGRLARRLGAEPESVADRLAGDGPLSLEWVERALGALGVAPGDFFARLYDSAEPAPGAPGKGASEGGPEGGGEAGTGRGTEEEEILRREEVEALVAEAEALIRKAAEEAPAGPEAGGGSSGAPEEERGKRT